MREGAGKKLCFAFSEKMSEILRIKLTLSSLQATFGEPLAFFYGLAHDKHGGEREVVVVNNFCKVFQLATINLLVGPCQMIAGGDGRVLRVFLEEFLLNIIDDGGRKEDAHGRLALGKQMKLLLLGHRSAAFATSKDNGLRMFGYRKLTSQFSSCSKKTGDARSDVIVHALLVEEDHLLLNGTKDTRVASMQCPLS